MAAVLADRDFAEQAASSCFLTLSRSIHGIKKWLVATTIGAKGNISLTHDLENAT